MCKVNKKEIRPTSVNNFEQILESATFTVDFEQVNAGY